MKHNAITGFPEMLVLIQDVPDEVAPSPDAFRSSTSPSPAPMPYLESGKDREIEGHLILPFCGQLPLLELEGHSLSCVGASLTCTVSSSFLLCGFPMVSLLSFGFCLTRAQFWES